MQERISHKNIGFQKIGLRKVREPHAVTYLQHKAPFWIATISLFAFVIGNMVGQHGWYAFFASVLGRQDDSAIVYVGTTTPVEKVVDYDCWTTFGGDYKEHQYRLAPEKCKVPLPAYVGADAPYDVYSMRYMSSYSATTENSGTHAGIDIRMPLGTPVRAVMNGRVVKVGEQPSGYGKYVVIKHPNVPDITRSSAQTTLYSTFAHVSAVYVAEGDDVAIGAVVALSGNSGKTTGPHLHFQMDRENVPYLPYFPGSMVDGYAYTLNAMAYVERNPTLPALLVADARRVAAERTTEIAIHTAPLSPAERIKIRREERLSIRLARLHTQSPVNVTLQTGLTDVAREHPAPLAIPAIFASTNPRAAVQSEKVVEGGKVGKVSTVDIVHDGSFSGREWEKVLLRLLDSDGNSVTAPDFSSDLVLRTDFGEAEFRPAILSPLDFTRGEVTVHMLPRGRRTVVIRVLPMSAISRPMEFER